MKWQRPAEVPLGRVWGRFKGRERNGLPGVMYQIRDMDESSRKQCLDMMQETFLRDEPLSLVLDIKTDKESVESIRNNWEEMVSQNISIACYTEEEGKEEELVAFNILIVKTKDDDEEDFKNVKGDKWKKLLKTLVVSEELVNVFDHYGIDKYMSSSGLTVLPTHRGQNIGAKLIAVREEMCKLFDIKAACTVFTATTSQVLAAKCGYEVLATLPYSAMLEHGVDLAGCQTPEAKVMAIIYDL